MRVGERHGKESASDAARSRSLGRVVALFAALVVSLTLTAAASANVSFTKAYGWGVVDGMSRFETCTSTCQAGIQGGGAGQLHYPYGVATDSSGDVYVADQSNERIDEFSAAGAFIKAYGWGVSNGASQFETCTSTCQPGIAGAGAGQFYNPRGVATDSSGDVYVADTDQARIEEFSAAGAFIKAYGWGVSDGMNQFETCTSTCQAGREGYGAGEFNLYGPTGIATDPSGDVYVTDESIDRIEEFSAAGAFIKAYGWGVSNGASQFETCTSTCQAGIPGGGAGQLNGPQGVATDSSGDVYVADESNERIDEFSAAGAFVKAYGWGVSDGASQFETCTSTCRAGIEGDRAGQLNIPLGVATDSSGNVYVAAGDDRIEEFSAAGSFVKAYGWGVVDGMNQFETCTSTCQAGIPGGGAGQFNSLYGIGVATDPSGDVYVADTNNRINEFGSVAPSTLSQGPPTSATVTDGAGYSGQLTVSNPNGTVSYTETASADSSDVVVSSTGAIRAANTLAPGTYTVSGSDSDTAGDTGSWSFRLTVTPKRAPAVSKLRVSPRSFSAEGRKVHGGCVKLSKKNKRDKPCQLSIRLNATYTLNAAVNVSFKLALKTTGRKVSGKCVTATHKNKHHSTCTLLVSVHKTITRSGVAGSNKFSFTGQLAPGTYELTVTPAGGTSQTVTFKVTG